MSEKIQVVTDLEKPSFLSRIPLKKVAVATALVGAVALAVVSAKNAASESEDTETDAA